MLQTLSRRLFVASFLHYRHTVRNSQNVTETGRSSTNTAQSRRCVGSCKAVLNMI